MSDWRRSNAACFLMERFGGETPRKAMCLAVSKLMTKTPHESFPVYPSRYAARCRANPKPLFIRMSLDGALKLNSNQFQILIRDAVLNTELPLLGTIEATRTSKAMHTGQLVFDYDQPSQIPQQSSLYVYVKPHSREFVSECQYDAYLPQHVLRRQRFTYAHELCHTLFYDLKADCPYRPYTYNKMESDPVEESLCNLGAGCLLMPNYLIENYVGQNSASPNFLLRLCSDFDVSLEAATVHIARSDIDISDNAIIIVSKHSVNRYTGADQKLRVRGSIIPRHLRPSLFIPENVGIERLGLVSLNAFALQRFSDNQLTTSGEDVLTYKTFKHKVKYVHTRILGNRTVVVSHLRILD